MYNLNLVYIIHGYYFSICKICKKGLSWSFINNHTMYCQVCGKCYDIDLNLYALTRSRWFKQYYESE